mgnify:CR=1 FL=1
MTKPKIASDWMAGCAGCHSGPAYTDGRMWKVIGFPVATNTPVGILMPFRNLGGMFDLGWPHLGEVLAHQVRLNRTTNCLDLGEFGHRLLRTGTVWG